VCVYVYAELAFYINNLGVKIIWSRYG